MSWIDVLIVFVFVYSIFSGTAKGLVLTLGRLVALVLSLVVSFNYSGKLGDFFVKNTQLDEKICGLLNSFVGENVLGQASSQVEKIPVGAKNYVEELLYGENATILYTDISKSITHIIAFFVILFASLLITYILVHKLNDVFKLPVLNLFNKIGGFVLGFIKGALFNSLIVTVLYTVAIVGLNSNIINSINNSSIAPYFFIGYLFY